MGPQMCEDIPSTKMRRNHLETSWKHLNQQRSEGKLCDIEFHCNGGKVRAHKCVLASVSEYFNVLFTSPISTASSTNVVVFDDFAQDVVALLMDVIYSEVDIPGVHVVELLRLADFVQMHWLVDMLVESVRGFINESNVCEWYATAEGFGFAKLKFLCKCYVRENSDRLKAEEVERCFVWDVPDNVEGLDTDLNREVVIMRSGDKREFLIDPKSKSIEMFDSSTSSTVSDRRLTKFWSEKGDLLTSFVHTSIVYFVTSKYTWQVEEFTYSIWKFQHITQTLDLVFEITSSDLCDMLVDKATSDVENLYVSQFFYDDSGSLYVLCNISFPPGPRIYGDALFKFDMKNLKFIEGYVLAESSQMYRVANLKDYGTCLVSPDYVLNLEKHNFEVQGYPGSALFKTDISQNLVNDMPKNRIFECSPFSDFWWDTWDTYTVNKDGQFYCLLDDDQNMERGTNYNLVLRLDMVKCSWVLCDGRLYDCTGEGDGPYQKLFHCGSTLYRHWADENSTSHETTYLDEEENALKEICFTPETQYQEIDSYMVVPYHILI